MELAEGVIISIDGKPYKTLPASATLLADPVRVPERDPPIRFRKNVPTSWLRLSLIEGKNRQVRRMTAKIGFPTLRLIRYRIEKITLENLQPGDIKEIKKQEIYSLLFN
jgi:23S rRNA pseudouridine2457 synthase